MEFRFKKFLFNGKIISEVEFKDYYEYHKNNVYEVVRVINSKILFLNDHINRLNNSILLMHGSKINLDDLIPNIEKVIRENEIFNGNIKIEFIFKDDKVNVYIYPIDFYYPDTRFGVASVTLNIERDNPYIKSYNYSLKKKMEKVIEDNGVYEVLLVNKDGLITEGSRSNIYFIKDNNFFTAPIYMVLNGVTRINVNKIIRNLGFDLFEDPVHIDDIAKFDACFLTSTSSNVLSINKINDIQINSSENKYLNMVSSSFEKYLKKI